MTELLLLSGKMVLLKLVSELLKVVMVKLDGVANNLTVCKLDDWIKTKKLIR